MLPRLLRPTIRQQRVTIHLRCLSTAPSTPHAFLSRSNDPKNSGISFLTLDRPAAKNSLSVQLLQDFRAALDEVRFDGTTRALIINSSTPAVFCAGADLKERRGMSQLQVAQFLYNLRQMLGELDSLPAPTIAALDGAALGGGLELALACDLRVASLSANKLGLPETRLAIIPGAGGTQRLSRLIGVSRAKDLIFTSKVLSAQQAHELGIVNYLADEGQSATERAVVLAQEVLKAGPLALRAAKLAIDTGSQLDLESGLDFEATCYQTILKSTDRLEGLKAFAEKRPPVYKGE
ncbi:ClpP/crotonase-like domain-containing protein [Leucosporidium creatinivorum]|uniref:ClpP/crotonase-like domain-containing protein n=1 Tax=Leucosporidium creatinivorum TaxID=106004 RepID=A0A1Y2G178_9BASI|nr:ClpP/crotonase-like domain-containing protein [Leucosporidium creatinivorum]